jgi:putative acetyltransferase
MTPELIILDYKPEHHAAFRALNHEWISHYFTLEALDNQMLDDPQGYILDHGGHILMASYGGELVGTCSLIKEHEGVYELAKMAVSPTAQGLGIGWALGQATLAKARALGAHRVELLSNSRLTPALKLYEKLGFRHVPVPPTPYQRTDVKMVLEIKEQ